MQPPLTRQQLLPEPELPASPELLTAGRRLAQSVTVGACPFLTAYGVASEADYKRCRAAARAIMLHAQIGYRSLDKSRRAYAEICERVTAAGYRVDRYGICLDWSMGYPASQRAGMPRGTGLILAGPEEFAALTGSAPVAPHFGDFVIGTPAAVENTSAALAAGCARGLDALTWLADPFRLLAYQDEQARHHLAVLGLKAARVVLPPAFASGFGQLIRDILMVDPADQLLQG